jgi:inosine-uridine nucleoside N-ribohydrolase
MFFINSGFRVYIISFLLSFSVFLIHSHSQQPVKIIFDTDMWGDCDDVGALAVLNALSDLGEAEILAVVTNQKIPSDASAGAVDAINTWYGRPDIPIGTYKRDPVVHRSKTSPFSAVLKDSFPNDAALNNLMPDALDIYRKILSSQPDTSVVICSVGALSNLADLLNSGPDKHSSLGGTELVRKKVRRLVVMGGEFPRSPRPEYNTRLDPASTVTVAIHWPGEIIWQGFEVGYAIYTGAELKQAPPENPVRKAYELRPFRGQRAIDMGKPSHDQAAVLIAVRGAAPELWRLSPPGYVVVDSEGNTEWESRAGGNHYYVSIKPHPAKLEKIIGGLMSVPPIQ